MEHVVLADLQRRRVSTERAFRTKLHRLLHRRARGKRIVTPDAPLLPHVGDARNTPCLDRCVPMLRRKLAVPASHCSDAVATLETAFGGGPEQAVERPLAVDALGLLPAVGDGVVDGHGLLLSLKFDHRDQLRAASRHTTSVVP